MSERIAAVDQLYTWVWQMGSMPGIIPPFCVELTLKDGTNFFLHSVQEQDEATQSLVMRFWDLRYFEHEEMLELRENLNGVKDRSNLDEPGEIHAKLDWASVRLHLANIDYAVEWNDRLFPREERKRLMGLIPEVSFNGVDNA